MHKTDHNAPTGKVQSHFATLLSSLATEEAILDCMRLSIMHRAMMGQDQHQQPGYR